MNFTFHIHIPLWVITAAIGFVVGVVATMAFLHDIGGPSWR